MRVNGDPNAGEGADHRHLCFATDAGHAVFKSLPEWLQRFVCGLLHEGRIGLRHSVKLFRGALHLEWERSPHVLVHRCEATHALATMLASGWPLSDAQAWGGTAH